MSNLERRRLWLFVRRSRSGSTNLGARAVASADYGVCRADGLLSLDWLHCDIQLHTGTPSDRDSNDGYGDRICLRGLTDFGPGRSKLFGNSTDEYMKVHSRGPAQADVTEGSSGIWERLHYDWSDPNHVVLKTTDSNTWGGRPVTPTPSRAAPTA